MSTIHGCFLSAAENSQAIVRDMLATSAYWNPDAITQASSPGKNCTLGKAALFNTQRSKADHVYQDSSSGLIISANARIDNRPELIEALPISAVANDSLTDGQLILRAYQHWGEECPRYLLGDFVFVIWDEQRQRLFCARDHFGVKVLFYSRTAQGVMVSSEHNAFFATQWQPKVLKERWLINRLWDIAPTPFESPYQGIEVMPAAHSLVIDHQGIRLQRYWQLEDKNDWQGMDDEALIAELKQRFERAVKRRLDSAYPLGAELSEGLDSNGIVGFGAQLLGKQPLYTFSYQCEAETEQNRHIWHHTYQDIYAMHDLHDNIRPVWRSGNDPAFSDEREAFFEHFGGVLNVQAWVFSLRTQLAQQQGIRTLLSGWGGDHCVTSYGDFYESELLGRGKLAEVRQLFRNKHRRGRGAHPVKAWGALLLKHYSPWLFRHLVVYPRGLENVLRRRAKTHFMKKTYARKFRCKQRTKHFINAYSSGRSVKQHDWRELFNIGLEHRLVETELWGRMARVEYRYPMLDIELVEFAYNVPGHLKVHKGIERFMYRQILEGVTTPRIQWRRKADVDSPKLGDPFITERRKALSAAAENSPLIQRYCDKTKLISFISMARGPQLANLELLQHLEQQPSLQLE